MTYKILMLLLIVIGIFGCTNSQNLLDKENELIDGVHEFPAAEVCFEHRISHNAIANACLPMVNIENQYYLFSSKSRYQIIQGEHCLDEQSRYNCFNVSDFEKMHVDSGNLGNLIVDIKIVTIDGQKNFELLSYTPGTQSERYAPV